MVSRIQKWGNSLAVRIPKAFADEMKVAEYASIQMMMREGALIITPMEEPKWSLEELLGGVTEDNIHGEWETGSSLGNESW